MKNEYRVVAAVAIVWIPLIGVALWLFWLWNQDKHKSSEENHLITSGQSWRTIYKTGPDAPMILRDTDKDEYYLLTDNGGNYRIASENWISPINRTDLKQACEALRYMNTFAFPYKDESPILWVVVECQR